MPDSNSNETNSSDDESNSNDKKINSSDESNLDDNLKRLTPSVDLSKFVTPSVDLSKLVTPSVDLSKLVTPSVDLSKFVTPSVDLSKFVTPSVDLSKLLAISIAYSQFVAPSSKQIKIIKSIFESLKYSGEVISERTQVDNLISLYKELKLVFVFGSGVSKNYGLPDWNTLLQKLLIKILESKQKRSANSKFDADTDILKTLFPQSPIVLARNIHLLFNEDSNKVSFENLVRESLYEEINDTEIDPIFNEVYKFCTSHETVPNIDSIITFNFDDILEKYLTPKVCEPIYEAAIQSKLGKLPVYHVHGFLPRKDSKEELDSSNKITFSEDLYHQLYTDVYCWSNIVQIDKFTNNTCLFIGISLTDPNLRRLLDVAKKLRGEKSAPHYIIKERYNKTKIKAKVSKTGTTEEIYRRIDTINKYEEEDLLQSLIDYIEESERRDALSFGVNIIWVDNYNEEIPRILSQIRNS